jgi:DNA-binding CsgD family transcriptional regulator
MAIWLCARGDYLTEEFIDGDELYQDYVLPAGTRYMAGYTFNHAKGIITLHTRKGPFDRDDVEQRVGALGRHGCRAMKLALQFAARTARGEILRHAIDHERIACFMIDSESRLLECSHAATAMIDQGTPFKIRQGLVALTSAARTKQFRELVARCGAGTGGGMMRVGTPNDYFLIEVVPAGVTTHNPFDMRRGNCALVFVRKPEARPPADALKIMIFLDCTPAESEIGAALLRGCSPAQIASDRKVSLNTVRTQIRSLLDAAGVTHIPELISQLSGLG